MRTGIVPAAWLASATAALPSLAGAHGFDERYDLPAPLGYFVAGAACAVALTFVIAILLARRAPPATNAANASTNAATNAATNAGRRGYATAADGTPGERTIALGAALPLLRLVCRAFGLMVFALTVGAALSGTADPMMNLAPTLVWIIWWIGFSLAVACIGNLWPVLDPWGTLFDLLDAAARRAGRVPGIALNLPWPRTLGVWPAAALLLLWSWLEVVYPIATVPYRLGCAALIWSAITLGGMLLFGRAVWQRHGDVFAIYFATLGRMAPLACGASPRSLALRMPGTALIGAEDSVPVNSSAQFGRATRAGKAGDAGSGNTAGMSAFVVAMLSTVLFDGLHGGQAWLLLEQVLKRSVPQWMDVNGYFAGTVGLLGVWLAFYAAYQITCAVTARLARGEAASSKAARPVPRQRPASRLAGAAWSRSQWAYRFAFTLVPIAVAYNVAHNFSALLIQGQHIFPLLSDPFGWRWNLFGTANLRVNIGLVDAQVTWCVAVGAIVLGHVIAVWLAHRVVLRDVAQGAMPEAGRVEIRDTQRDAGSTRRAALVSLPLTLLMIAYTAISLLVIAEPMVMFESR